MNRQAANNYLVELLTEARAMDALECFEREKMYPPHVFNVDDATLASIGVVDPAARNRILLTFAEAKLHERREPRMHGTSGVAGATYAAAPGGGVVLTDIAMPFGAMVRFMVMWSLASIPAALILIAIFGTLSLLFGGLLGGLMLF